MLLIIGGVRPIKTLKSTQLVEIINVIYSYGLITDVMKMCDMLHENNVMFRDTNILPDNTYTHVNSGSQTCSWLDHIECPMFCPSPVLTAAPSKMLHALITVQLKFH